MVARTSAGTPFGSVSANQVDELPVEAGRFLQGGHVRQARHALCIHDGDHLDLAGVGKRLGFDGDTVRKLS
jgi:hypothetical protein